MKYQFPNDFYWGAASSGPQTEGIKNKANLNVWDEWYAECPERFFNKYGPDVACDTYNRYREDTQLMADLGFNSFRTSIQWGRLIDDLEQNTLSEDGVKFYRAYFKEMIDKGIKPIINLYHFDMPQYLMDKYNGFESKHVIDLFVGYAEKCFELFADQVKMFTVFNEPIVPIEFGYFYDAHRPNVIDPKRGIQAAYNSILAQSRIIQLYHQKGYDGEIGTILNVTPVYPRSNNEADIKASHMCDLIFNRSFLDPATKGEFPLELISELKKYDLMPDSAPYELSVIADNTVDFLGLNYYVPRRVCATIYKPNENGPWMPEFYFENYVMPGRRVNPHRDDNEIYPKALYDMAIDIKENYNNIKWYLAEFGISMTNEETLKDKNGFIDDTYRTDLVKEHLTELHKALVEGCNCFGFHQWTFIDNWSWLNSHKRRYGFYYLDLETRNRIMKKHGYWFKQLVKNNGF